MIHVSVAIEQISLEGRSGLFLSFTGLSGLIFIISVAIVPRAAMRLPRTKTNPTKVCFTRLILANHVIASTIFLNGCSTSWTLFGIGRYPIGCFGIIVTFLDPFLDQMAADRITPIFRACEAKRMATTAFHWPSLNMRHFDCIAAIWS